MILLMLIDMLKMEILEFWEESVDCCDEIALSIIDISQA